MSLGHHADNLLLTGAQLKAVVVSLGHPHQQIPLAIDFGIHHDYFRAVSVTGFSIAITRSSYVYKVTNRVVNRRIFLFIWDIASDNFRGDGHDTFSAKRT
jgi:hypothetical protein